MAHINPALPAIGDSNWGGPLSTAINTAITQINSHDDALSSISSGTTSQVDSIAALKTLSVTSGLTSVRGYYTPGDGGGGIFRWDSTDTTTAADGGVTIASTVTALASAGRWKRIYEGRVNARWFGVNPSQSDNTAAIQAAVNYVQTRVQPGSSITGGELFIPAGYYKSTFTGGTSGLSTITITGDNVLITGEGFATNLTVRSMPTTNGSRLNYFFTWTKNAGRGVGGGIRDIYIDGNSMMEWAVFLDCWRVWELDFVQVTNVYSGMLDACNNQQIAAGQEGENIVVRHWNVQQSTGGPYSRYAVRFRPGVTSGASLNPWSDVWVSDGLAKNIWDTGVVFDAVSRSHIDNVTAANSAVNFTNTGDGATRSGCLHAVAILNSTVLDNGRHTVDSIYLESHSGAESPTTNSVIYIDSTNTGQNYGSKFTGLRLTLPVGSAAVGYALVKNTASTAGLTRDHVIEPMQYSWPGLAQLQVGANVLRTVIQTHGGATSADIADAGTSTKFFEMNDLATIADLSAASGLGAKQGTQWWASVFAPPITDDTPTVSVATTGAISGGTTVVPTPDYFGDPAFRYDGCADVVTAGTNLVKAVQPSAASDGATYSAYPEFVTSPGCDKVDIGFTLNAAGSTFGVRITVNGKWLTLPVQWFTTTPSTLYYVRLTFPTAKARQIKVETINSGNFAGVVVPSGETVTRPPREVRKRMVVLGDSYVSGANGNTTTDPTTNGCSSLETFPNYVAKLLGCDSIINLGAGGTGWVTVGTHTAFGARVGDILAASPHIVLAAGSRNDSTSSASAIYAAVLSALTQLVDVPVVEVCGLGDVGSTTGTVQPTPLNEAVKQATRTAGRHFNDVIGVVTSALKNSADSVHPSIVGAQTLGATFYSLFDREYVDDTVAAAVGGRTSVDLTLTASPSSAAPSSVTVTLTATQSTARAGKVSFYANGVLLSTVTVASGSASYSTSTLAIGTYAFTARFLPSNPVTVKPVSAAPVIGYVISANLGFTDTFTRADGAVGSTENGKAYTVSGTGTFSVASNQLVNTGVTTGTSYCVADAGTPNGTFAVTIGGTVPNAAFLALRFSSSNNLLRVAVASSQIVLQQVVSGTTTTLFTGSSGSWVAGDTISVVLAGDTITVKKNGTAVTGINGVTVAQFDTNTKFGVGHASAGTGVTYDNLSFA